MAASIYNVFVGAETGLLKGVNVNSRKWSNLNEIEAVSREHEITAMCWGDTQNEICVGSRNRMISIFDKDNLEFTGSCHLPGGEGIIRSLAKYDGRFISAVESGLVTVWDEDNNEPETSIDTEGNLWKMRQNESLKNVIATGGKENDLKIWDLNQPETPIFQAKNVRNDFLNLRVPVWITDMAFLPDSDKIVTVTGHHQMRVYDPSTPQRRPVVDIEFDEYPITAMSLRNGYNQVVIGNTQGKMCLMDLRKGALVHSFKGFAGSIRAIACHQTEPVVASCGLDRILRIHDIESKRLLDKFYLKSRLNCLMLTPDWSDQEENVEKLSENGEAEQTPDEKDGDPDDLWDQMDEVLVKKKVNTNSSKRANQESSQTSEGNEPPKKTKRKKLKKT